MIPSNAYNVKDTWALRGGAIGFVLVAATGVIGYEKYSRQIPDQCAEPRRWLESAQQHQERLQFTSMNTNAPTPSSLSLFLTLSRDATTRDLPLRIEDARGTRGVRIYFFDNDSCAPLNEDLMHFVITGVETTISGYASQFANFRGPKAFENIPRLHHATQTARTVSPHELFISISYDTSRCGELGVDRCLSGQLPSQIFVVDGIRTFLVPNVSFLNNGHPFVPIQ